MYNLPTSDDLLKKRLQDMAMAQQPNQLQTATPAPQSDLVAERLRSAGPSPDAVSPVAASRNYVSAPTPVPRAGEHVSFPSHVPAPPVDLAQERLAMSAAPQQADTTAVSGVAAPQQPNAAPYPFTPRPEEPDLHAHGKPIGLGARIMHSLKSAGMGFMRGGVGGAIAGGIGGAVDPDFYHRAQHYYKDLPLWQQRQQDEIEQAKTQSGLNESNARIGNIGVDNDLAKQRFTLEQQNAGELARHHGALETTAALRAAKVTEKPPIFDASRKAMWDAKSGKWVKAPGAENIPEKDMTPAERERIRIAQAHLDLERSKGADTQETEDVFGFPPGSESTDAHRSRKQEAMTHIDSLIARGDIEPDEGAKMKLSWDNANPPPKPVKVGSRRAKTAGGGAAPAGGGKSVKGTVTKAQVEGYMKAHKVDYATAKAHAERDGYQVQE